MLVVGGPVVEAVNPIRPFPPVGISTGFDSMPFSADIFREMMLDPAGSLFNKYAALLSGLSLCLMAAADTRDGRRK